MFMHGDFFHIFFNMFALWMFGNVLENYWGPKKFLVYYFVCGIGAAMTHYSVYCFDAKPVLSKLDSYLESPAPEKFESFYRLLPEIPASPEQDELIAKYNSALYTGDKTLIAETSVYVISQYRIDFLNAPNVIGASGAVFGILLAFGVLFPNVELFIMFFPFPIKAKYAVILYGAMEFISGVFGIQSNIAHFAHLGGMLFGFILIWYWKRRDNSFD